MRRLSIAIIGLTLALLIAALLALRSESFVLATAYRAVDLLTDLRLELRDPHIDIYQGTLSAAEAHLIPKSTEGPALVSLLDLHASTSIGDLLSGRPLKTSLRARQVLMFVSEGDAAADPAPTQWLRYLSWLPVQLRVDQVHLITASANTWIFPLKNVRGDLLERAHYRATADADYQGEPLGLVLDVFDLSGNRQSASAEARISFTAPHSGSKVTLEGSVEGTRDVFQYKLNLDAFYRDISQFLRGFEGGTKLAGELRLKGDMTGDVNGFVLSDADFVLDNMPEYGFEAGGTLTYERAGNSRIDLIASGEMASVEYLVNWLDVDFGDLGRVQSSLRLGGSLDRPVIEQFRLLTSNAAGLSVSLGGRFDLFDPAPGADAQQNSIEFDLQGPSLTVLEHYLGAIPYDLGAWRASGEITGSRQKLLLKNLVAGTGSSGSIETRTTGMIGDISEPGGPGSGYKFRGIQLSVEAQVPDSAQLALLLDKEIPGGHALVASARVAGSSEQLNLADGAVSISTDDLQATMTSVTAVLHPGRENILSALSANISAKLSDTSALAFYTAPYTALEIPALGSLEIGARLEQKDPVFQLVDVVGRIARPGLTVETRGRIGDLAQFSKVSSSTSFSGVPVRDLLSTLLPDFRYEQALGTVHGSFKLADHPGSWQLSDLLLGTSGEQPALQLTVAGKITDLAGFPTADLNSEFSVGDSELLEALTGLPLKPVTGSVLMRNETGQLTGTLKASIGETSLDAQAVIAHQDQEIEGLKLVLATPHLHLQDFGFDAAAAEEQDTAPESAAPEKSNTVKRVRDKLPAYPLDIAVKIDEISGDNTSIDSLDIQLTGSDKRYTLTRFSALYDQSLAEIRGIIDFNPEPPALSLAGQAVAMPLNTLTKDLGFDNNISGSLTVLGGITAIGTDKEELLRTLNGSLAFALENAIIEGAAYDLLATDVLEWIYSGALTEKSTYLDCTMAKFLLRNGVATTDSLYVESERMVATGKAEFDLVKRKMDLRITPLSKSRKLQIPSEVKIKGPMSAPKAEISPINAAADATAAALMLIPSLTMKLFGISQSSSESYRPCRPEPAN